MKTSKKYYLFYLFSVLVVLAASYYPLHMGFRVVSDMIKNGTVFSQDYPKYIIPYTPISIALIIGVILIPLLLRFTKKFALWVGSALSVGVFFVVEILFERLVVISTNFTETVKTPLESWQMFMCYIPPQKYETRTWTEVNVLMGEYSPAFKIHFYVISVVLILSFLNCFYGFAKMIRNENYNRKKALILQTISSLVFLGLCILACFTAFFRGGEITVSALSAWLMSAFFVVFGITMGIYAGSFLLGKRKSLSVLIPAAVSSVFTTVMYIGEMILLNNHLYRFGSGFFFDGLSSLILAPVDIVVILASGVICALILLLLNRKKQSESDLQSPVD